MEIISGEYTAALAERRALIKETNSILMAYERNIDKKELAKKVCKEGCLGDKNWSSAFQIVTRFFAKRYMSEDYSYTPAEFFSSAEEDRTAYKVADKDLMYFVFTALVEAPLFDFVSKFFYITSQQIDVIDRSDVVNFLQYEMSGRELSFTDAKVVRMANGILSTLKEFGLLIPIEDKPHKTMRINRPYLNDRLMLQIIYFLKKNAVSDYDVVHNRIWYLFGMNGLDVIKRLNKRPDAYIIQSAGSIVKLSRPIKDDIEFLSMLSAG